MPHRFSEGGYRYRHRHESTTNGCALSIGEMIEQVDSGTTSYERTLQQCSVKMSREASEQLYQVSTEALPLGGAFQVAALILLSAYAHHSPACRPGPTAQASCGQPVQPGRFPCCPGYSRP